MPRRTGRPWSGSAQWGRGADRPVRTVLWPVPALVDRICEVSKRCRAWFRRWRAVATLDLVTASNIRCCAVDTVAGNRIGTRASEVRPGPSLPPQRRTAANSTPPVRHCRIPSRRSARRVDALASARWVSACRNGFPGIPEVCDRQQRVRSKTVGTPSLIRNRMCSSVIGPTFGPLTPGPASGATVPYEPIDISHRPTRAAA